MTNLPNGATNNLRIAWLLPTSALPWQPMLSQLTQRFPNTTVFASFWPGHDPEFADIRVQQVGSSHPKRTNIKAEYDGKIDFLPIEIISHLWRFKPDVVFSNSFGVWTILALLFKFIGGWRLVIAYEGSSPSVDFRQSPLRLWVRRVMVRLADACISNSQRGQDYLVNVLGAAKYKVAARPYQLAQIHALLYQQDPLPAMPLRQPIFLYVGQLIERKGVQYLIEACGRLRQQGCDDYTVLIIGDGAKQDEFKALSQVQGVGDRIQWLGRLDYSQLGVYFQTADVFVFPTLEDTWGLVVQEAMLFDLPILCSKRAGASELVNEGMNGHCFEPDDIDTLARLMRRFIDDPTLVTAMGNASRQISAQHTPAMAADFLSQVAIATLKP